MREVFGVTSISFGDRGLELRMQGGPLIIIEAVPINHVQAVDPLQVDDLTFG